LKRISNTYAALVWIVLLFFTPGVLYYVLGHRLPFGDSAVSMMLIAPAIWLFLILVKKGDHEFLRLLLKPVCVAEWLLWVPGLVASTLSVLTTYRGPLLMAGLVLGSNGAGCGMIKGWIKRQLGLQEAPPSDDWWPAKHD
jgi:hypothetical protein